MNELERLVKKYVDQDAQYQAANRLVLKHKKLQEEIKAMFAQHHLEEYSVRDDRYDATLSFRPIKSVRVDAALIPEELRTRWMREYVSRRESLVIRRRPG